MHNDARSWYIKVDGSDGDKFIIRDGTGNDDRILIDSTGLVTVQNDPTIEDDMGIGISIIDDTTAYGASPLTGVSFSGEYDSSNNITSFGGVGGGKATNVDGATAGYVAFYVRNEHNGNDLDEMGRMTSICTMHLIANMTGVSDPKYIVGDAFSANNYGYMGWSGSQLVLGTVDSGTGIAIALDGGVYMPDLAEAATTEILHYNTTTKEITWATPE